MSRFFGTGSDSETESSSSGDEEVQQRAQAPASAFQWSDEEEETKRVVRSAKEKRYEELTNIIRQIRNHRKIKDMSKMLSGFEELVRAHQKAIPVIAKEEGGITPRFYIRVLVEMEDTVNEVWEDKDARKSMNRNNAKSLSTLRQKLRKYNREFEEEISKFRENPDMADEEEQEENEDDLDEDSDSDAAVEGPDAFRVKPSVHVEKDRGPEKVGALDKDASDDDDDDSIDWGESSESESSSTDDDTKYTNMRDKFLKKTTQKEEEKEKKEKEKKKKEKEREKEKRRYKEKDDDEGEWTKVVSGPPLGSLREKLKMFSKDSEVNHLTVMKKLAEIVAARGKKGTDRKEQIELLHELKRIADENNLGPAIAIKIDFAIVAALYDYNPTISAAMRPEYWERVLMKVNELLDDLMNQKDLQIGEHVSEESECVEKPPYRVRGCILTVVERMEEEFTKMLKECDAHSTEYVDRLKDEAAVCKIIAKLRTYLEQDPVPSELCRCYLRLIEHLYYKFDPNVFKQKEGKLPTTERTSLLELEEYCKYIYAKDNTDRLRTRAILCHIYHHALHDNWFAARDLMLMSHLQDAVQHSDIPTQILYNRTMVQLGLCAFRHGNIRDAHNALLDIQSGGRAKELLSQGLLIQRQMERSSEQEKKEKQRQMPFHMHINLELLECVYLVSAMLMEIPYMAAHEFDARRRMISKSFHHQLKVSERQALVGPPESMREHVVAASKAMRNGDWRACRDFIINEKMNSKVWDLFYQADKVREMLTLKIQEETLRTYLFTFSYVYNSISLDTLALQFDLPKPSVHSVVSKMIINEELMASMDEPTQTVVMHRTEPSRLQSLALQVADKVGILVDYNERILEAKSGTYFGRGQQQGFRDRQPYDRRQQQNWGDRGRRQMDRAF